MTHYYPNRFARALLIAMGEILGVHGRMAVLDAAGLAKLSHTLPNDTLDREFPFAHIAAIHDALETLYGVRGGRGMAQRIGRAWLGHGMMQFGALRGLSDSAFKRLPMQERVYLALLGLAEVFSQFSDQQCHVAHMANAYHFVIAPCACAEGRSTERPACMMMLGLLQELAHFVTGGNAVTVRETTCRACGDEACTFVVLHLHSATPT